MILLDMQAALIDNNDSFTYNIVELVRKIAGVSLDVITYKEMSINELGRYRKLIISPGPGLPDEFPKLREVFNEYYSRIPMLGVCLGHEAIAQFFGAKLSHLPTVVHGQPKEITITADSILFKDLPRKFKAGLYHSWVIDKGNLPDVLEVTAISEDDNIMALRHREFQLYGVQFHPESIITEYGKVMVTNFLIQDLDYESV